MTTFKGNKYVFLVVFYQFSKKLFSNSSCVSANAGLSMKG